MSDTTPNSMADERIKAEPLLSRLMKRPELGAIAGVVLVTIFFVITAAASILEVIVAQQAGYYDELCLDVEFTPSFSTANYSLVAGGEAQFSSSGSFSELATQAAANEAERQARKLIEQAVEAELATLLAAFADGNDSMLKSSTHRVPAILLSKRLLLLRRRRTTTAWQSAGGVNSKDASRQSRSPDSMGPVTRKPLQS